MIQAPKLEAAVQVEDLLTRIGDLFGGGLLGPLLIVGGVIALLIALKVASMVLKLAVLGVAGALLASAAPWAGEDIQGTAATCAANAVEQELDGWQALVTKRVTVSELSDGATCAPDQVGLSSGVATVRLRTFFDVPIETWVVEASRVRPAPLLRGGQVGLPAP